jgi:putative addiction module component (TIGR02574 family)
MSIDLHVLTDAALALDPAERLALASTLIDSVEDPVDLDWESSWTVELERRSAEADGREVRGSPWHEVRARLLRRLADR